MGRVKEEMMEWESLGITPFGASGKAVCANCIEDPFLQEFVRDSLDSEACDYCGTTSATPIAAEMDSVLKHIAGFVNREYTDPANELPYDGREGGYQGASVLDNHDLMDAIGFSVKNHKLYDDVADAFTAHDWCRDDAFAASPSERKRFGWQKFCRVVQHERRFTFWTDHSDDAESQHHPDYLPPSMMLAELAEVIGSADIIRKVEKDTAYWRVRVHSHDKTLDRAEDLTPPPLEFATQPNRMSPAGVPMFYGAVDWETSYSEVVDPGGMDGRVVTGAAFRTLRELTVLDLTEIPVPPSYFSENGIEGRQLTSFLRYFRADLSKPIRRDHRQHIEYVPTQVFTEFVRYELPRMLKQRIDGILYRSSRNQGICCVLFVAKEGCLPPSKYSGNEQILTFDATSKRVQHSE